MINLILVIRDFTQLSMIRVLSTCLQVHLRHCDAFTSSKRGKAASGVGVHGVSPDGSQRGNSSFSVPEVTSPQITVFFSQTLAVGGSEPGLAFSFVSKSDHPRTPAIEPRSSLQHDDDVPLLPSPPAIAQVIVISAPFSSAVVPLY